PAPDRRRSASQALPYRVCSSPRNPNGDGSSDCVRAVAGAWDRAFEVHLGRSAVSPSSASFRPIRPRVLRFRPTGEVSIIGQAGDLPTQAPLTFGVPAHTN